MTDLARLITRFVRIYRIDPIAAKVTIDSAETDVELDTSEANLLANGDKATVTKLRTLLLDDDQSLMKNIATLRQKPGPISRLTEEEFMDDLRNALDQAGKKTHEGNFAETPPEGGDDVIHRGARMLGLSVVDYFQLWFEYRILTLRGHWEEAGSERFDGLRNFERLEDEWEDRVRLQSPDLQAGLIHDFLKDLDKRCDRLERLEELQLIGFEGHFSRPFNEACHCYLAGYKTACVALCGAIIEGILKNKLHSNAETEDLIIDAKNNNLLKDDEAEMARSIYNLRNSAMHKLNKFDKTLKDRAMGIGQYGIPKELGTGNSEDVWIKCLGDTRHLIKVFYQTKT